MAYGACAQAQAQSRKRAGAADPVHTDSALHVDAMCPAVNAAIAAQLCHGFVRRWGWGDAMGIPQARGHARLCQVMPGVVPGAQVPQRLSGAVRVVFTRAAGVLSRCVNEYLNLINELLGIWSPSSPKQGIRRIDSIASALANVEDK